MFAMWDLGNETLRGGIEGRGMGMEIVGLMID